MKQWTRARTRRMAVVLLLGLSLLLTACDAQDVLQFLRGPGAGDAPAATARVDRDRTEAAPKSPAKTASKAPKKAAANTPDTTAAGRSAIEREVYDLLAAARRRAGAGSLTLSRELSRGARAWSCRMADSGDFRHADLRAAGVSGENIAWGQRSAAEVHSAWMDSPGHRSNRMSGRWTEYGIGVCARDGGRLHFTERFR